MGVAKKVKKRPSSQPNVAKPKKEILGKGSKAPANKSKQVEVKKSARIQNQTKSERKAEVKINAESHKKLAPKSTSSSPLRNKVQEASPHPQKEKPKAKMIASTQSKRSARKVVASGQYISQTKNNLGKKASAPLKAEKVKGVSHALSSKNAAKQTAESAAPKNVKAPAKSAKTKSLAKATKKIATQAAKTGQSDPKTPSVAGKLQKKKRKSVQSPLKKKKGGKIIKSKKSLLSQKRFSLKGSTRKKPSKSQLKLAVEQNRGVVYFSHLPHGFYENELKAYCGQFGVVTGVHLPRSVNGNSKGFAFVEFKHPEVAEVVAETMNNYLMHTRLVKAELVPLERQKPWIFRNGVNAVKLAKERKAKALAARTRKLTPEEEEVYKKKAEARVNQLKKKLSGKGINLEFVVAS